VLHDAADDDRPGRIRHRVDVELEGILEESDRSAPAIVRHVHRPGHVAIERAGIEHDRHAAPPSTYDGRTTTG
jgi:hypothetical protein